MKGERHIELLQLRDPNCSKCELHRSTVNRCIISRGSIWAKIMVIGEAPGEAESIENKPFMGDAGKVMDKAIREASLDADEDIYATTVCKCRPYQNRTPTEQEIAVCSHNFLDKQIRIIRPEVIMLMGKHAAAWLFKGSPLPMRGFPSTELVLGEMTTVIYTWHPAYSFRSQGYLAPENGLNPYQEMVKAFVLAKDLTKQIPDNLEDDDS